MRKLIFFEKPGCKGNLRQKELLRNNGFKLEVKSILEEPCTEKTLKPFFDGRNVPEWFNMTAPAIKERRVNPDTLNDKDALEAMMMDPLLIRRPLIVFEGKISCGFDS